MCILYKNEYYENSHGNDRRAHRSRPCRIYTDGRDRSGFMGYVGACFATVNNTLAKVSIKGGIDLKAYDRIVISMPIWVEGPCAVGRALIRKYRDSMPSEVYYVVTHGGTPDYPAKTKAMDSLLGRPSSGQFSVRTRENDYVAESAGIADMLV